MINEKKNLELTLQTIEKYQFLDITENEIGIVEHRKYSSEIGPIYTYILSKNGKKAQEFSRIDLTLEISPEILQEYFGETFHKLFFKSKRIKE